MGTSLIPIFNSDGPYTSSSGERPSGRVDHPDGKAGISDNSEDNSSSRPSGRVDHPGMTGGSSSSNTESTNKKSGSTGRRR